MVSFLRLVFFLLAVGTLHNELGDLGGDNAQYILLAQSLATGQGYRTIQEPGAPIHTTYPFGFPLLLTPIVALWGTRAFLAMHALVVGWGLFCLFLWHRWVREEPVRWIPLAAVGCLAITPLWVASYGQILSEFPYLAFSLLALLWARRRGSWGMTAFFLLAAYFTRTVGVALILAVLGCSVIARLQGRSNPLFLAGAVLLPILAWHGRSGSITQGAPGPYLRAFFLADPYQPDLGPLTLLGMGRRLAENLSSLVTTLGRELVWPTMFVPPWAAFACGGILALLIAVGFLRRLKARSAAEWYTAGTLSLILAWPFQEARFLLPILPWLWLYLLEGAGFLLAKGPWKRWGRWGLVGLVAVNLAGCAWVVGLSRAGVRYHPVLRGFVAAHDWIRSNTPPEAVILSRKPTITALLAERRAVLFPYTKDGERIWEELRRQGVTHVVMDGVFPETERYLLPAIRAHPDRFDPRTVRFGSAHLLTLRKAVTSQ